MVVVYICIGVVITCIVGYHSLCCLESTDTKIMEIGLRNNPEHDHYSDEHIKRYVRGKR